MAFAQLSSTAFQGKTYWIGGGSSGIGFSIAQSLVQHGANVIIMARDEGKLESAKSKLEADISKNSLQPKQFVDVFSADITDNHLQEKVSLFIEDKTLSGILLNAGGPHGGDLASLSAKELEYAHSILMKGPVALFQGLQTQLEDSSSVVAITSTTVKEINADLPISGMYRTGLTSWLKSLAQVLAPERKIRVNSVAPGYTDTEKLGDLLNYSAQKLNLPLDDAKKEVRKSWEQVCAMNRLASPEEIAGVCLFLFSELSSFITGQTIVADGGQLLGY